MWLNRKIISSVRDLVLPRTKLPRAVVAPIQHFYELKYSQAICLSRKKSPEIAPAAWPISPSLEYHARLPTSTPHPTLHYSSPQLSNYYYLPPVNINPQPPITPSRPQHPNKHASRNATKTAPEASPPSGALAPAIRSQSLNSISRNPSGIPPSAKNLRPQMTTAYGVSSTTTKSR
jgi:hypothetical protein